MERVNDLPVVFVPGYGADIRSYRLFLTRFPGYVLSGEHRINLPQELSWDFFFEPIHSALSRVERAVLFGHSLGGAIALSYAAQFPEKIEKVVALAPPVFPFPLAPDYKYFARN